MASALSRFPFQRLSTGYSHFIDGFPQIRQGFMGVNAFRHSRAGVSEYHLDGRFIGSCSVEHCGQRVAALMGRVVHVQLFYGVVKEAAEGFVVVTGAEFVNKHDAESCAKTADVAGTYVTKSDAEAYAKTTDVSATYLTKTEAESTYTKKTDTPAVFTSDGALKFPDGTLFYPNGMPG